jgi:hypothetical protein
LPRCHGGRDAITRYSVVLDEWVGLGNLSAGWWLIQQVVAPLVALDRLTYAAVLAGAVEARTDALPVFATDTDRLRSAIATVCERLGDTAARAALERGATLADADVLARARRS